VPSSVVAAAVSVTIAVVAAAVAVVAAAVSATIAVVAGPSYQLPGTSITGNNWPGCG